jgi:surface antigen
MAFGFYKRWGIAAGIAALVAVPMVALSQRPPPPPLPELPATPQMDDAPYPECRDDWRRRGDGNERAEDTNRCIARLDSYNADVLVPYRSAMIEHQGEVSRIYTEQVQNDFDYTQEQADGFFAQVTQEHEASNPDGAHFETYRAMETRYQDDRAFLQDTFCSYVQCEGRPAPTAVASGGRSGGGEGDRDCGTQRTGGGILGGILGGIAGDRLGIGTLGGIIAGQFAGVLVAEIACQLTTEEQELAAEATEEVTQQEEVGATAEWTSPVRGDVSGSSTVTALNSEPSGATCLEVTDVVIVDGQETTALKTMCRAPGESRYTLQA